MIKRILFFIFFAVTINTQAFELEKATYPSDQLIQNFHSNYSSIDYTANSNVIESYISGDFEGWDGDTIFQLDNGQIWKQTSYAYYYHYAYRPRVLIYQGDGCYKMKVENVDQTICVERLR
jgi:hypothetical protein